MTSHVLLTILFLKHLQYFHNFVGKVFLKNFTIFFIILRFVFSPRLHDVTTFSSREALVPGNAVDPTPKKSYRLRSPKTTASSWNLDDDLYDICFLVIMSLFIFAEARFITLKPDRSSLNQSLLINMKNYIKDFFWWQP